MDVSDADELMLTWHLDPYGTNGPFKMTEAAIAMGLCVRGRVEWIDHEEGALGWSEWEFRCADGSGAWIMRKEWRASDAPRRLLQVGVWKIINKPSPFGDEGEKGRFEQLQGSGTYVCDWILGYWDCEAWGEFSIPVPLVGFHSREIGSFSFTALEWGIRPEQGDVFMVVGVRPLSETQVGDLQADLRSVSGQLVWDETAVDVSCRMERRESGDEWILIGDVFSIDEQCDGWTDPDAMRNAFEEYGLPEEACISFTFENVEHELCEPLT